MKYLLAFALIGMSVFGKAQDAQVEKSVFGVQTGLLGIWGYNEFRLSNNIALRSELGFDSGFWGGSGFEKTLLLATPVITLEPRLYYNLSKRVKKSKSVANNSGNFISLKTSCHPGWFAISNYDDVSVNSDISIMPTWGIRRNIGTHFNYEAGIGLGYKYEFARKSGDTAWNFHLRVGYSF